MNATTSQSKPDRDAPRALVAWLEQIAPRLDAGGVEAGGWSLRRPGCGSTSEVYFIHPGPDAGAAPACAMLRVFTKGEAWRRYRASLARLEQLHQPAPRELASRGLGWLPGRGGRWLLAESYLDGPMVCEVALTTELAAGLGRSLGRLHANTQPWFEWAGRRYAPARWAERCRPMFERRLERIEKLGGGLIAPGRARAWGAWLTRRLEGWCLPERFPLVHTELDGDDMIWVPERGEAAWIDVEKMRYNHRGLDLVVMRRWLERTAPGAGDVPALLGAFDNDYWEIVGRAERERWNAEADLFEALWMVARLATRLKVLSKDPQNPTATQEAQSLAERLSELA